MSFASLYRVKLSIDEIYLISDGVKNKEVQLVHITKRGFNLVNTQTGRLVFKKHVYPLEINRDGIKELTFLFPRSYIINKK